MGKHHKPSKRATAIIGGICLLVIALVFLDVIPIGYKQVTFPQEIDYVEQLKIENRQIPQVTCPSTGARIVKLNYHVKAERDLYNQPARATQCPTYQVTSLLYW